MYYALADQLGISGTITITQQQLCAQIVQYMENNQHTQNGTHMQEWVTGQDWDRMVWQRGEIS